MAAESHLNVTPSAASPWKRIIRVNAGDRRMWVTWADTHTSAFHYIWLRDNCKCSQCGGDPMENRRQLRVTDIPLDLHPESFSVDGEGNLVLVWALTRHVSVYDAAWLRQHCYSSSERARRRHQPILWDSKLSESIPKISFQEVIEDGHRQLDMLQLVRDFGFAVVYGAPLDVGTLEQMAAVIGYIREFGYGRIFDIMWTQQQKSVAHSKQTILPHTDEPFRYHPPGISIFDCLQSSSDGGGESILVDGFNVVERLRQTDPDAVELLSKVPQSWYMRHINGEFYRADGRLICLDIDGRVIGVRFNDRCHAPLDLPDALVEPFYEALRKLSAAYDETGLWLTFLLNPGEILLYDNERVLHGRKSFKGERHLRLCAVERDEFHSRLRVLGQRFESADSDLILASGVGV